MPRIQTRERTHVRYIRVGRATIFIKGSKIKYLSQKRGKRKTERERERKREKSERLVESYSEIKLSALSARIAGTHNSHLFFIIAWRDAAAERHDSINKKKTEKKEEEEEKRKKRNEEREENDAAAANSSAERKRVRRTD